CHRSWTGGRGGGRTCGRRSGRAVVRHSSGYDGEEGGGSRKDSEKTHGYPFEQFSNNPAYLPIAITASATLWDDLTNKAHGTVRVESKVDYWETGEQRILCQIG